MTPSDPVGGMHSVSAARSFAHERELDRADPAIRTWSVSGASMFRSIRSKWLFGSLVLALSATIVPARAQGPLTDGQRITVPESSRLRSELATAVVAARKVQRTLELSGIVEADPARTVRVLSPAAGRVVDIKVQPGDRVAAQQELAVIYVGGLGRARIDTPEAQPLTISEPTGGGQIAYPSAVNESGEPLPAQLRALGVPVDGSQDNRLLSLRAPVGGSIIELRIKPGDGVTPAVSMMTIANLDTIWVAISVPTKDVALLVGQSVQLRFLAYPREYFTGQAGLAGSASDNGGPTTKMRIAVPNPNSRLKLNMSASIRYLGLEETVPIIPVAALVSNRMVFVEIAPWMFEARAVRLGRLEGGQAMVGSGVKVGDRVAVPGRVLLLALQQPK
jgi:membrane fusion protein, heavy metal efflux system